MEETKGRIFNIQRFSVHDGPGIRDTVFVKGCPLHCAWCSNPESQSCNLELGYNIARCIGCGACIKTCKEKGGDALHMDREKGIVIDREKCLRCFSCVSSCYAQAMHIYGEDVTVEEVLDRTINSQASWRANGGITVSGGEVMMQPKFTMELLKQCHALGVHTAIETSLFAAWETIEEVVQYCDLVFCDMKFADSDRHRQYTGVPNELIKENLKKMRARFPELEIIVRTPVIPGINDDEENILEIVEFLKDIPISDYELLAFHNFGAQKYDQLNREYSLKELGNLKKTDIEPYNNLMRMKLGLLK